MEIELRTVLIAVHLGTLVLGFGGAMAADLLVARNALFRKIEQQTVETVEFIGKLVTAGLAGLWITGIGITVLMSMDDNALLTNPKFALKVAIVVILTLNAFAVHNFVMPHLARQVGKRMFDGVGPVRRVALALIGAVSITSWAFPMLLGIARELNGVMPFIDGAMLYLNVLTTVAIGAILMVGTISILTQSPGQPDIAVYEDLSSSPSQQLEQQPESELVVSFDQAFPQAGTAAIPVQLAADLAQLIATSNSFQPRSGRVDYPVPSSFGSRSSIMRGDIVRDLPQLNTPPAWTQQASTWNRPEPILRPEAMVDIHHQPSRMPPAAAPARRLFSLSEPPRRPEKRLSS